MIDFILFTDLNFEYDIFCRIADETFGVKNNKNESTSKYASYISYSKFPNNVLITYNIHYDDMEDMEEVEYGYYDILKEKYKMEHPSYIEFESHKYTRTKPFVEKLLMEYPDLIVVCESLNWMGTAKEFLEKDFE